MYLEDFFKDKCFETEPNIRNKEKKFTEEGYKLLRVVGCWEALRAEGRCLLSEPQEQLRI